MVDDSGESKESKELAYHAVAGQIGLVYWKSLFDPTIEDQRLDTAGKRQSIGSASQKATLKKEALDGKTAVYEKPQSITAGENIRSPEEKGPERANIKTYLSGRRTEPSRMRALGHGAKKYLASNKVAEGRRLNRRVEIELVIP